MTEFRKKTDRSHDVPPYEVLTEGYFKLVCHMLGHKFRWASKGKFKQQVCERCGLTGETLRKL